MLPEKGSPESDKFHRLLYRGEDLEGELIHCDECGRLLFRKPGGREFSVFTKENGSNQTPDRTRLDTAEDSGTLPRA